MKDAPDRPAVVAAGGPALASSVREIGVELKGHVRKDG